MSALEHARTPWWIRWAVPMATWRIRTSRKQLFLTFDDSPSEITEAILGCLKDFDAQATFFCVGENVKRYPELAKQIVSAGHSLGNHSYSHCNGWSTPFQSYVDDVEKCRVTLKEQLGNETRLFRPPYGRITLRQMTRLSRQYEIVMWDVMGMDYKRELDANRVAGNVMDHVRPGSIALLHDSELAAERVLGALPQVLSHFQVQGYQCLALE